MNPLGVVSLFAGVGGIDLAAERAGMRTLLACEIDERCRSVLASHFPDAVIHPDVRTLTADDCRAAGAVPDRTVLTAGFPCQDVSVAGRRQGMGEGTRTGLFFEIVRILASFPAAWVVLENVPGLLSATCICPGDETCIDNGRRTDALGCGQWRRVKAERTTRWFAHVEHPVKDGACQGGCIPVHGGVMGAVLGSLAELGYGLAYRILDAQYTGVPQRRRRVIIVGHLGDTGSAPAEILFEPESSGRDHPPGREAGPRVAATLTAGVAATSGVSAPGRRREDDENLVTAQDTHTHTHRCAHGERRPGLADRRGRSSSRSTRGRAVAALTANGVGVTGPDDNQAQAGHLVTHTLTSEGADASEDGTGRGTPIIAFAWQAGGNNSASGAFNDDGTTPTLPRSQTLAVALSENQRGELNTTDKAAALSTGGVKPGQGYPAVLTDSVRRLTPLECERLQGFPDNWTAGQADAQRYKQMGNSVAVPVLEWVMRRLAAVDARTTSERVA